MKKPYSVSVASTSNVCETTEKVRESLERKEGVGGWDQMSHVIQSSANALAEKDTQFRLSQGLIDKIRELLLDTSEETKDFRKDALALIEPVSFVGKNIEDRVEREIIVEAFGHTDQEASEDDRGINIVKFFEKYAEVLGYDLIKKRKNSTGNIYNISGEKRLEVSIVDIMGQLDKISTTTVPEKLANLPALLESTPDIIKDQVFAYAILKTDSGGEMRHLFVVFFFAFFRDIECVCILCPFSCECYW